MDTFFSPAHEIKITQGNLPHWHQEGVIYFITFRLADSLSLEKVQQLRTDREMWRLRFKSETKLSLVDWKGYNRLFNEKVEEWLNNGCGNCALNKNGNSKIMSDALKYFDRENYILDEWVVMPNLKYISVQIL